MKIAKHNFIFKTLPGAAALLLAASTLRAAVAPAFPAAAAAMLPLYFEENTGIASPEVRFVARGLAHEFLITPVTATITLRKAGIESRSSVAPSQAVAVEYRSVRLEFVGADASAMVSGESEHAARVNYLTGNDPSRWRTGRPVFSRVRVNGLYPGIDLIHYGNQQRLEYDFVVAPRIDPAQITVRVAGADSVRVDASGELVMDVGGEEIRQPKPYIYQQQGTEKKQIAGGYRIVNGRDMKFEIGAYDTALPLVIDPLLSYSTLFGGAAPETAWAMALGDDGSVYIAGETFSTGLASSTNVAQTNLAGATTLHGDAFVAKFDNFVFTPSYITYIGGHANDAALGLAVDERGHAFITGYTDSTNFPTANTLYTNIAGIPYAIINLHPLDAFVTEIGPRGTNLIYSTYLGGRLSDYGSSIAVDAATNIYVAGYTESTNFPTFFTARTNYGGTGDAFVAKIGPERGSNFIYSMYLGGTNKDVANDIAADAAGRAFVVGYSASTNFPLVNPVQSLLNNTTNLNANQDVFVTSVEADGSAFGYSTFLGGTNRDQGRSLSLAADGSVFVTGLTFSGDFVRTATNLTSAVTTNTSFSDGFCVKLDAAGSRIYSLVFGGWSRDEGWDIATDTAGRAHVVGLTVSTNFPVVSTGGFLRATNAGGMDAFFTEINSNGTALVQSAYLGGSGEDAAYTTATDLAGNSYFAGRTASADFPQYLANSTYANLTGTNVFVAKIVREPVLSIERSGTNVILSWPGFTPDYQIQSSTLLTNLSNDTNWTAISSPRVFTNGLETVTTVSQSTQRFFRLRFFD